MTQYTLSLLLLLFTVTVLEPVFSRAIQSVSFTAKIIHWNSPESPYHNPNITNAELSRLRSLADEARMSGRMNSRSHARIESFNAPIFDNIYGEYLIRYSIGSTNPPTETYGVFDTGSGLVWLQCLPCLECYKQMGPYFNYTSSATYRRVPCDDLKCSQLAGGGEVRTRCHPPSNTCEYSAGYVDGSFSQGIIGIERFIFQGGTTDLPMTIVSNILFGCGQYNGDYYRTERYGPPGVIGLNLDTFSLVKQLGADQFSYCFPSQVNADGNPTGLLKIGNNAIISEPEYQTPLYTYPISNGQQSNLYYVKVVGIKVGGRRLMINESVFETPLGEQRIPNTMVDSGTTFTRLCPEAYDALTNRLSMYGRDQVSDTGELLCFERISNDMPKVTFMFEGKHVLSSNEVEHESSQRLWQLPTKGCQCWD